MAANGPLGTTLSNVSNQFVFTSGACTYTVAPNTVPLPAAAGSGSVTVTTTSSCTWQVSENATWLTPSTTSGTGTATVSFAVTANTSQSARSAQVTVAGTVVTVTQEGAACAYTVAPETLTLPAAAGSGSVTVTTTSGCTWQVSENATWLTPSATSGTGTATVSFAVTANTSQSARSAQVTVAGTAVTVTQQGTSCTYGVSPTTLTLPAAAGSGSVTLTTTSGCTWQVSDNATWLTPAVSSGTGNATVSFSVTANTSTSARSAQLTVAGTPVTVTQQGAACAYTVAPAALTLPAAAGSGSVTVTTTSGCTWQVSENASWLTPSLTSGTGTATVSFAVTANTSQSARSAQVTVAGTPVTVTQQGTSCTYGVSPTTVTLPAAAGSGSVTLTTGSSCSWQVSDNASWLTPAVSNGTGGRTISFSVTANTSTSSRTAQLTIGGVTVTVTQEGAAGCSYSVTPTALTLTPAAGTGSVTVTTGAACAWQAATNSGWLTPAVNGGSGPGTLSFLVSANISGASRTGELTVAGTAIAVTQEGNSATDADGDGMPDAWETTFGLDPSNPGDATSDTDGDGLSNRDEYARGSHPRGFHTRYFAEGASNSFFHTRFALLHPGAGAASVLIRFLKSDGTTISRALPIPGRRRMTLDADTVAELDSADFSTVIESDQLLIADRTMTWDGQGYGSHAETALPAPSLSWYLAEGATHGGFDLFYLFQNPNAVDALVRVRYLRPWDAPIERTYTVGPNSRMTIWVDQEQFPEGSGSQLLHETDVSAAIDVLNGQPIIVERAMYFSRGGEPFTAGHESAGVTQPSTQWFFAEGATGPFFDLYLLLANPGLADASVRLRYLLPDGQTLESDRIVPANSRVTVSVDAEEFPAGSGERLLDNAAVSTIVESQNGVPIIAERSMWFPATPAGAWSEAHNSPGATATGLRWAVAEGEAGGPASVQTYVLIANTSAFAGSARVTVIYEDGTSEEQVIPFPANSRTNVDVATTFPAAAEKRFGVVVESLGATPAQLVIERAMYSNAGGALWVAGTNALGTRLP